MSVRDGSGGRLGADRSGAGGPRHGLARHSSGPVDDVVPVDAIVLAGGRGSRLGGVSKAEVLLAGRPLLDRALDATAGARFVVVVGPPELARPGVTTVLEDPPLGGPVAGLDAGLRALDRRAAAGSPPGDAADPRGPDDGRVLVLACDVPLAAPAIGALHAALDRHADADGAHLVRDGHPQLVAVHRGASLRRAVGALAAGGGVRGVSVRRLLDQLRMVPVADAENRSADADTWDDVARLESVLARGEAMTAHTAEDLDRWVDAVAEALGVSAGALDRDLVLDLTRDVAHTVARPAVPLTTFLMGCAVAARGGDRAALHDVATTVAALAAAWDAQRSSGT